MVVFKGAGGRRRAARAAIVTALGLALLPATTTIAAYQDMTSLLDGGKGGQRWQAYFVPSPVGAIEKAEIAFAGKAVRQRLPAGAGVQGPSGDLFALDTVRPIADSPDEARVSRGDKTRRVLAVTPVSPPKAFSAGSILERQSLLRPSDLGERGALTAFAVSDAPSIGQAGAVQMAMNFQPTLPATDGPAAREPVMLASLETPGMAPDASPALGYAATPAPSNPLAHLFNTILRPAAPGFVPPIGAEDHAWAATPLPADVFSAKEQTCLANGIYFEARGESALGQAAVAQVILNRVRNPTYPKTICGVVYQNRNWRNRCQFSFACDGTDNRIYNKRAFAAARQIGGQVTAGDIWIPEVGSATHYHATYVKPRWARAMEKVDKIGRHIFYRTFGGGWD